MARMRHKMQQKKVPKTEAARRRRTQGGKQPRRSEVTGQGHIDELDRILMSKKQLGKRRSNPHANISLSNKKRKKLLKAMAHQQRDQLRKKAEEPEDLETSLLFGKDDDNDENVTKVVPVSLDQSEPTKFVQDDDAVMQEI